jgi:hypothetical protein
VVARSSNLRGRPRRQHCPRFHPLAISRYYQQLTQQGLFAPLAHSSNLWGQSHRWHSALSTA